MVNSLYEDQKQDLKYCLVFEENVPFYLLFTCNWIHKA